MTMGKSRKTFSKKQVKSSIYLAMVFSIAGLFIRIFATDYMEFLILSITKEVPFINTQNMVHNHNIHLIRIPCCDYLL